MFKPSSFQEAIFKFIESGIGHGVVKAVPGSGKTTTLVEGARRVREESLFMAFNKKIAEALAGKLKIVAPQMLATTIHSTGRATLAAALGRSRKIQLDEYKYKTLWEREIVARGWKKGEWLSDALELTRYACLTLTDASDREALTLMCKHFGLWDVLDRDTELFGMLPGILKEGIRQFQNAGIISFDDMVWLPVVLNLPAKQYGWVFIDEAQDLNAAQLALVLKCVKPGVGRMLFVGDPNQSIYGFSGADSESMDKIIAATRATILPLSICYRCPTQAVGMAGRLYPGIEAAPTASAGNIEYVKNAGELATRIKPGDMVLCRTTAPLVKNCLELIRHGINARVEGRNIGAGLAAVVKKVEKLSPDFEKFALALSGYKMQQVGKLSARPDNDAAIEALMDKCAAIESIFESAQPTPRSYDGLLRAIDNIFDNGTAAVRLSTVHRAKGLEADNVYILRADLMPHPMAKQGWEIVQENNCQYVALTRTLKNLYFVEDMLADYGLAADGKSVVLGGTPVSPPAPAANAQEDDEGGDAPRQQSFFKEIPMLVA